MDIICEKDYKTNVWQGGITHELFIHPKESSLKERNFDLRISSAIINLTESDFSDFSGYTRYIMPLEGDITLYLQDKEVSLQPGMPFLFSGNDKVKSTNSKGATDFNVIFRNHLPIDFQILSHAEIMAPPHQTVVFALENIKIDGKTVRKHDTALMNTTFQLEGTAAVIRF